MRYELCADQVDLPFVNESVYQLLQSQASLIWIVLFWFLPVACIRLRAAIKPVEAHWSWEHGRGHEITCKSRGPFILHQAPDLNDSCEPSTSLLRQSLPCGVSVVSRVFHKEQDHQLAITLTSLILRRCTTPMTVVD
jgi:hypothetical protein